MYYNCYDLSKPIAAKAPFEEDDLPTWYESMFIASQSWLIVLVVLETSNQAHACFPRVHGRWLPVPESRSSVENDAGTVRTFVWSQKRTPGNDFD